MARSRLSTALSEGFLSLPEDGDIVVIRPPVGHDLSDLPRDRTRIIHGFRPDADFWSEMGFEVARSTENAALTIVVVPRSKRQARALVAKAATLGGAIVVDGAKTDGVDGLFREIRSRLGEMPSITKAHGRLFAFTATAADFADWAHEGPEKGPQGYYIQPGIFSEDGTDRGSVLLAETLPAKLGARVADLGAGWGYLAAQVLTRDTVEQVHLVEAEADALDCARLNITDDRAAFHWADARDFTADQPFDTVVCNPPFHTSRKAEPSLGEAFIAAAARLLSPQGELWLVANRHLPYEAALREAFTTVEEAGGDSAFKIFRAARPKRDRGRRR
ncbi:class I SAM-dependent methyltransferase [Ponticoccus sp. SC2-23]|uniref:class I SAM-dependent methyltransferase n=1 Tax=Alexandriicola marinus TaxID=2081710 RepID=UPI000FD7F199|nr:methyltransferase [Alexandriicola marinus]MBM1220248.1 class I SAM-dependent methyltransferase [Ponticoccus sp. SC6-9]MBM1224934.1 class I SAM-dependent methyltransferase [Ponticoccus sp. SC6-15]MBM1228448.1 class I SAM-dependent methyltransferase [Ponticoccus sp. SC6-38]MBM1233915.1 class I SAM-dependent methyltransferase [Ponticoccus sp. SC6-45]MBM1238949.1 class I SAM-dependent methyltransferase [Ponticoccus sp. SC6-49]MBM1242731.1 class I SAM-dependent methyltransferase [Ponticoccus sp